MRIYIQIQETELTKAFSEIEKNLWSAERAAYWLQTAAEANDEKVSIKQKMETNESAIVFEIGIDLKKERKMREEVAQKAKELRDLIREYEKVLVKKIALDPDVVKDQGMKPTFSE